MAPGDPSQSSVASSSDSMFTAPESMTSPASTVRQVSSSPDDRLTPTAPQTFAEVVKASNSSAPLPQDGERIPESSSHLATGFEKRRLSERQQQDLGIGRPGAADGTPAEAQRPNVLPTPELQAVPGTPYHDAMSPGRASSIHSFTTATEDDEYYDASLRPRTAGPGMPSLESTPRGGTMNSSRGAPHTAFGSSFGSPTMSMGHSASNAGSMPRQPRMSRFASSGMYPGPSGPVPGSMSRSASRVRPPLNTQPSTSARPGPRGRSGHEDDDVEDRGAELIKQRQRERRQKARMKQKNLEFGRRFAAEDGSTPAMTPDPSLPNTGLSDETFLAQQGRGSMGRSVSRTRAASTDRRKYGASDGYFPRAGSIAGTETPRDGGLSPRDERRAPSILSSAADEEEEDAIAQDRASFVDEIVQDVVEEETGAEMTEDDGDSEDDEDGDDEGVTLRDRQDALNIEHPFGLPIWKPALYRKSRSVTRNAESALHLIPSAAAERHLLPGNLLWVILFGWWIALACFVVAVLVSGAEVLGGGRGGYGKTLRGLAWYIGWPFGKYVEGEGPPEDDHSDEGADEEQANGHAGGHYGTWTNRDVDSPSNGRQKRRAPSDGASSNITVRGNARNDALGLHAGLPDDPEAPIGSRSPATSTTTIRDGTSGHGRHPTVSFAPNVKAVDHAREPTDERSSLLGQSSGTGSGFRRPRNRRAKIFGRIIYWPGFLLIVAPLMLFVCIMCWFFVITIPMAKLTWALLKLLWFRPLEINFRSAPKVPVPVASPRSAHGSPASADSSANGDGSGSGSTTLQDDGSPSGFTLKRARLTAGQVAPTSGPTSTVLLCTYRAVGLQYYKYTVGGVNILFINLLPLVFFTIIDGMIILPFVEKEHHAGHAISPFLKVITAQALIFVLALASVIPLSYFIGMAVASISAQSSIGMGAVINATFGSVIEIILYSIALTQGKGRLVEGSIVGSILAGVLLMPGASMCSGAFKRKEQKFNAKSAGVTSTMLIMAIIGTLTPTMFYQTYGSFELHCEGCPDPQHANSTMSTMEFNTLRANDVWMCNHCYYEHPDPEKDPFYQDSVKTLMYCCAGILLFSYLIGLWFSLRTHAAQIWQNPQQLMKSEEAAAIHAGHPALKSTLTQRITPQAMMQHVLPMHKSTSASPAQPTRSAMGSPRASTLRVPTQLGQHMTLGASALGRDEPLTTDEGRLTSGTFNLPQGYTPFLEGVDRDMKSSSHLTPMRLPSTLTPEDFTRAVAVATVSALRHQGSVIGSQNGSAQKHRQPTLEGPMHTGHVAALHKPNHGTGTGGGDDDEEEHGGHEAPSWTRGVSAGVLLACTLLYAIIAEILVDVVDVVLQGSGIDEKFLGLTLFALVPNTTEFMNAMSFALNGNIALSMEIGSAYALQVCLLQIPAMVAFSALYRPDKMGDVVDTFTLIFPRWDVIAIILSIFLLTYTYIEARSNYHRGSILVLAYVVLIMGFYYAPLREQGDADTDMVVGPDYVEAVKAGFATTLTKLWA